MEIRTRATDYRVPAAVLAVLTAVCWWAWTAWDVDTMADVTDPYLYEYPYESWQVLGGGLCLIVLAVAATWRFPAWLAIVVMPPAFTVAWAVVTTGRLASFTPFVWIPVLAGATVVALCTAAIRAAGGSLREPSARGFGTFAARAGGRLVPPVVLALLTAGCRWAWLLGDHATDVAPDVYVPGQVAVDRTWQGVGCLLCVIGLAIAATWRLPAWLVIVVMPLAFTAAWALKDSLDDGYAVVGEYVGLVLMFIGVGVVALITAAIRRKAGRPIRSFA